MKEDVWKLVLELVDAKYAGRIDRAEYNYELRDIVDSIEHLAQTIEDDIDREDAEQEEEEPENENGTE